MPACAKMISTWVRKVLAVVKAHMSLGSLWGSVVSVAFVVGISLVSILQAGKLVPIVCMILTLDSWNHCSGEQGTRA